MDNSKQGNEFQFDFPTSWRNGRGIASQTGKIVKENGFTRPLLLTDRLLLSLGVVDPVKDSLEKEGISYELCDEVNQEPTLEMFNHLCSSLDLSSYDLIIAVGGGSVIDVAKGLSVVASFKGNIKDYAGFNKVPGPPEQKVIAIPTTSGTGSEISDGVVIIDEKQNTKFIVISKLICPHIALTDAEMTKLMPPKVTACSGVDALVHAVESYLSKGTNLATEIFSLKAIKLLGEGLRPAFLDGSNIDVREKMQVGATLAMISGMNTYLGLCHSIAMPLCSLYHMPHGQAVGMALPEVLRFNFKFEPKRVITVFKTLGFDIDHTSESSSIESGCRQLTEFLGSLEISAYLKDFCFKENHMPTIVKETMCSVQKATNPGFPSEKDIEGIVRRLI